MIPVGLLTAATMLADHPNRRSDHWEHDRQYGPMRAACAERGVDLRVAIWDDPALEPEAYAAFVIGTTWDYAERPEAFLSTLARLSERRPLMNPLGVVRWNLHKGYLNDLAARGAPIVPTLWRERAGEEEIRAAFDELGTDEIVVKPQVGASAWRQARIRRGEPIPRAELLPPGSAMIQPYLPAIESEGEYSLIFFDGVFSHCARKMPAKGDYRIQAMYGGWELTHEPSREDLTLAQRVIDCVGEPLLYGRVDMVRGLDGRLAVIELEVIEPYLYPDQGAGMGEAFASALERRLNGAR